MTILTITVTPLTHQLLLSEYGPEPIKFDKNELINDQLRTIRFKATGYQPRTLKWLCAKVMIVVHDDLARFVALKNSNIGIALFNYHREVLLRYVDAVHSCGVPAREAINRFYDRHGLTDDHYSLDSAYRRWVDYKAGIIVRKNAKNKGFEGLRENRLHVTASDTHLMLIAEEIVIEIKQQRRTLPVYFPMQIKAWALYKYGCHTLKRVGKLLGISIYAVHRAVKSIEAWIQTDTYVSKVVQDKVRPFQPN